MISKPEHDAERDLHALIQKAHMMLFSHFSRFAWVLCMFWSTKSFFMSFSLPAYVLRSFSNGWSLFGERKVWCTSDQHHWMVQSEVCAHPLMMLWYSGTHWSNFLFPHCCIAATKFLTILLIFFRKPWEILCSNLVINLIELLLLYSEIWSKAVNMNRFMGCCDNQYKDIWIIPPNRAQSPFPEVNCRLSFWVFLEVWLSH